MREQVEQFPNMTRTVSSLTPARIYAVDNSGNENGLSVNCMFNPYEYTVSKSNTYAEKSKAGAEAPDLELQQAGPQTLKLNLVFDTYEEGKDVTQLTRNLWKLMEPINGSQGHKPGAPFVAFEWGYFKFVSVITNMTQKFTLFLRDGTPVRAQVDVTFTQHVDQEDYQNPTSGGGPAQQLHTVVSGERLDNIAAVVYRDPSKWRLIADYNGIANPLALRPGQQLIIPERGV